MQKKIMLAFTGGLQSSVCLHWLSKKRGAKVDALIVDLGPESQSSELGEQAVALGAAGAHVEDCRESFIRDYAFKVLRASAVYERNYLLSGVLARPLIAEVLTRRSVSEGVRTVVLATYVGSDDAVRFRSNVNALAPELDIISPEDIPPLESRKAAQQYAEKYGIEPQEKSGAAISLDVNLWGAVVAPGPEIGTWEQLSEDYYQITSSPQNAHSVPENLVIEFEKGIPVRVDEKSLEPHILVQYVNEKAGGHGIGRVEVVEDRLFGKKAREIYEAPGACVLNEAHSALEELCLDYESIQAKSDIGRFYANLVYRGCWFKQLRRAYDAFIDVSQEAVNGKVSLRLYRGNITITGRCSPNSLVQ